MGWQDAPLIEEPPKWASAPMLEKPSLQDFGRSVIEAHAANLPVKSPLDTQHPISSSELFGGMANTLVGGVAHGLGTLVDVATGTGPGAGSYAEKFASPFQDTGRLGQLDPDQQRMHAAVARGLDNTMGTGPLAQTIRERVPQAFEAATTAIPILRGAAGGAGMLRDASAARAALPKTAEEVVARQAAASPTNMGAASAAPNLANVSPEFRQAIVNTARKTGGAINPQAFERQQRAETLLVPSRLTEGQALRDPNLISREQNQRGAVAEYRDQFAQQNQAMTGTMRELREQVGPDVFSTNATEHGDTLISSYRARNDAAQTNISDLYDRLRNAAGGSFPVDATALLKNATSQLHKDLLFEHAPQQIMTQLERMSENGMTFEQFEAMRTNLATLQRSQSAGGLEKRAAGVIRNSMEELPLGPAASQLKPYADAARRAAREHHRALEADPAYAAAVDGSVPPDRFVNRFVIRGNRDDLARMRRTLGDDPAAVQTMGVATIDHLREQARLNPNYEGNFAAASYNKALTALNPKLRSVLAPEHAEMLDQLGQFASDATFQPRGSYVDNSNSFVAAAADKAATVAEKVGNHMSFGLDLGTVIRDAGGRAGLRREARRATAPGAGLGRLEEGGLLSPRNRP